MKTLLLMLCMLFVAVVVRAQQEECYNPNTGQDCGQCYVAGKTCEAANGRCPAGIPCTWCRQIVRTEFCGLLYLNGNCWCYGITAQVDAKCLSNRETFAREMSIRNQQVKNRLMVKLVYAPDRIRQSLSL